MRFVGKSLPFTQQEKGSACSETHPLPLVELTAFIISEVAPPLALPRRKCEGLKTQAYVWALTSLKIFILVQYINIFIQINHVVDLVETRNLIIIKL